MFVFKKVVAPLLNPVPLCLELLAIGLIFLWFTRKQFVGKVLVTMAGILLTLLGTQGVSGRLLHTLEAPYPPLQVDSLEKKPVQIHEPPARWIVVLAGGIAGDSSLPLELQISHHSRVRLLEGIRLYHHFPGSKLVLSGGIGFQSMPEATVLSRVAQSMGVPKTDIVLEAQSRDTKDHPLHVASIVKDDPFILVTSAFHMRRALQLFAKQGLNPIPAPSGRWKPNSDFWFRDVIPGSGGFRLAELSFHEYLGLEWAWLRGQI